MPVDSKTIGRATPLRETKPVDPRITKPDIIAAREHTIGARRTRAHVIVCHDINHKTHALYEMFNFADRVSPTNLDALARDLAHDIIEDVNVLMRDLEEIKEYANRQLDRLDKIQEEYMSEPAKTPQPPKDGKA